MRNQAVNPGLSSGSILINRLLSRSPYLSLLYSLFCHVNIKLFTIGFPSSGWKSSLFQDGKAQSPHNLFLMASSLLKCELEFLLPEEALQLKSHTLKELLLLQCFMKVRAP